MSEIRCKCNKLLTVLYEPEAVTEGRKHLILLQQESIPEYQEIRCPKCGRWNYISID